METTTDNFLAEEPVAPRRPTMLTVLVILTWIWCGISFIQTVYEAAFPTSQEEKYAKVEQLREQQPDMAEKMEKSIEAQSSINPMLPTSVNLIAVGLSAFGAFMMWNLKRKGFWVYVGGELLPYLTFLIVGWEA